MNYILIALMLLTTQIFATEFKIDDGQVKFAKVSVVVNGNENIFFNKNKGDNFYDQSISFATNTVTRTYIDPNNNEVNLSTCVLYGFSSADDWRQAKKGYLNRKINELKNNDEDLDIIDVDSRIAWLKEYRNAHR